jgi:hypothetical protein
LRTIIGRVWLSAFVPNTVVVHRPELSRTLSSRNGCELVLALVLVAA